MGRLERARERFRSSAAVFGAKAKHAAHEFVEGSLFFGGFAAIAFGCWMIYHPAGVIVAGVLAVRLSFLMTK